MFKGAVSREGAYLRKEIILNNIKTRSSSSIASLLSWEILESRSRCQYFDNTIKLVFSGYKRFLKKVSATKQLSTI